MQNELNLFDGFVLSKLPVLQKEIKENLEVTVMFKVKTEKCWHFLLHKYALDNN